MKINKAQGQTLDYVGIYLKEHVFPHGQLYVALSRARTIENVKVVISESQHYTDTHKTKNIVYQEVLQYANQMYVPTSKKKCSNFCNNLPLLTYNTLLMKI